MYGSRLQGASWSWPVSEQNQYILEGTFGAGRSVWAWEEGENKGSATRVLGGERGAGEGTWKGYRCSLWEGGK